MTQTIDVKILNTQKCVFLFQSKNEKILTRLWEPSRLGGHGMIAGLPIQTFLWVTIPPVLGLVMALIYGITFKDDSRWLTLEDIFRRKGYRKDEDGNE